MNIELNRVYTLKLTNADEVVAKIVEDNADHYVVENPLSAVPTEKGIQLIFTVFTGDPKQNITINKTAIAMICQTREEVCDHYLEATTGIKAVRNSGKILLG
jgi:hypothetical protein